MSCLTVPSEADKALLIVQEQLAESLVAVYLHGSAVAGGLHPKSDVDLLAVIDHPLAPSASARLVAELMKISGHPGGGSASRPIELIIFLRDHLTEAAYPARCEFIYGEWLRNRLEAGEVPKPVCDPELTLVLAQARQEAISLGGPHVSELLPVIPQAGIRRAIGDVLPALIETLQGDERNVLLTLARMWRTSITGEFVSKDDAANWAAARLPAEQAAVLADAREAYLSVREDDWRNRQQNIRRTVDSLHDCVVANL